MSENINYSEEAYVLSQMFEVADDIKDTLSQISSRVLENDGMVGLERLSNELEVYGIKRRSNTLYKYAKVYDMSVEYAIPHDVDYNIRRLIYESDDPQYWADEIRKGASLDDIAERLRAPKREHKKKCPVCGAKI